MTETGNDAKKRETLSVDELADKVREIAAIAFAAEYQKQPHPCPDFIFSCWLLATAAEQKGETK